MSSNNRVNSDSKKRRSFVALLFAAGYGKRYTAKGFMCTLITIIFLFIATSVFASTEQGANKPEPLECKTGPLHNTYGDTEWLVYACNDSRSVVIVSAEGNPAMPFVFMLIVDADGNLKIHGEGTRDKKYTAPAFEDIKVLTVADISKLVAQANEAAK